MQTFLRWIVVAKQTEVSAGHREGPDPTLGHSGWGSTFGIELLVRQCAIVCQVLHQT